MLQVTTRDRIFAAVVLPLALVGAYLYCVHAPMARRLSAMRERYFELGEKDEIQAQAKILERRRDEAEARLAEAGKAEADRLKGQGTSAAPLDDPARLRRFVAVLGEVEGLRVISTDGVDGGDARAAGLVGEALGIEAPSLWRFTVSAEYGGVVRALELVGERDVPAIVEGVSFDGASGRGGAKIWIIDVRL